ncbi:NADH-quinone oxidoreductase subunit J [Thermopetrobacter sp. TC1]|uniref:NADH-quinone oxidoreductase subunit J n=1 Tax=Thermopetrobacter sp. TC1 TaxID=1495045 RepID=UPI00056DF3A1|nr:NADH-quinone oxidoreductase subunit J [Thermopetrobacter sp. TC1]
MIATVFFYMFAVFLLGSALLVITVRNPVHAVLFLILAFFNAAGLFLIAGAEFLAMNLIIVYVGAVMVLFLFIVMTLDVDFAELRAGMAEYLPVGLFVGLVLVVELIMVFSAWALAPEAMKLRMAPMPKDVTNTEALGRVIYTDYVLYFQLAGVILLVAMIGAIVLSLHHRKDVRRQNIADQVSRRRNEQVALVDVEPGQGLES